MKSTSRIRKLCFFIVLMCSGWLSAADNDMLSPHHPDQYTVVKGDTLWDISGRFLKHPWFWKKLWYANPSIADPDLIYPGDVLWLTTVNGQPRLTILHRNTHQRVIKLSPRVRKTPQISAIPPLKRSRMRVFLRKSQVIVDAALIEQAPRIVAVKSDRLIVGAGQTVYAEVPKGKKVYPSYGVYRRLKVLRSLDTQEWLGVLFLRVGTVQVEAIDSDVITLKLLTSNREVSMGDVLLPAEDRALSVNFMPQAPDHPVRAHMLAVMDTTYTVSLYDNVVIDQGSNGGIRQGDILAIKTPRVVKNQMRAETLHLPDEKNGLLMVYRVLDKISFGVVMQANKRLFVESSVLTSP